MIFILFIVKASTIQGRKGQRRAVAERWRPPQPTSRWQDQTARKFPQHSTMKNQFSTIYFFIFLFWRFKKKKKKRFELFVCQRQQKVVLSTVLKAMAELKKQVIFKSRLFMIAETPKKFYKTSWHLNLLLNVGFSKLQV